MSPNSTPYVLPSQYPNRYPYRVAYFATFADGQSVSYHLDYMATDSAHARRQFYQEMNRSHELAALPFTWTFSGATPAHPIND